MNHLVEIGPLEVAISGPGDLPWPLRLFARNGHRAGRGCARYNICCTRGRVEKIRPAGLLFESGGAWCEEGAGDRRRIVLRKGGPGGIPYQQLAWRRGERLLEARIDPSVLREGAEDGEFALREPLLELWAARQLRRHRAWLVHGALVEIGARPALALGQSGAGKSTLCRLAAGLGHPVYCDDRVILRAGRRPRAWSTPWHGEARYGRPASKRPAAILLLEHAGRNRLEPADRAESMHALISCSFGPFWSRGWLGWLLGQAAELCGRTTVLSFGFRPGPEAIRFLARRLERA